MSDTERHHPSSPTAVMFQARPEVQLLLLLGRASTGEAEVTRAGELISNGVDWNLFLELADFHRVFPLVHLNLSRYRWAGIPDAAREALAEQCRANQQRMMALTAELLRIFERFSAEGIEMIPLKGPALGMVIYGNLALRPAGDLDILIRPGDVRVALDLLRSCGYSVVLSESGMRANDRQEAAIQRFLYHYQLTHGERGFPVELHFNLAPRKMPFLAAPEELFRSAGACTIAGRRLPFMNDQENLLYLCLHGGKHAWSRLEWIVSVAELLRGMETVDEAAFWKLAERRGAGPALLLGLSLTKDLFGIEAMPNLLRRAAKSEVIRELSKEVVSRLKTVEADKAFQDQFQWKLAPTWREKLRWWMARTFHPMKDDIRLATCRTPWLYFLVRPIRSVRTRLLRAGRGVRGERRFARARRGSG